MVHHVISIKFVSIILYVFFIVCCFFVMCHIFFIICYAIFVTYCKLVIISCTYHAIGSVAICAIFFMWIFALLQQIFVRQFHYVLCALCCLVIPFYAAHFSLYVDFSCSGQPLPQGSLSRILVDMVLRTKIQLNRKMTY